MVMILKKGCNPARIHICKAVKAVGNSMSGYFQGQLCDAGVIPALVGLLEVDVTAPGSVAGAAAGAIARLVATDENVGARIVELAGLGMLVYLLRDGDAGSRAQACKCLWMICQNESYKLMLLQVPTPCLNFYRLKGWWLFYPLHHVPSFVLPTHRVAIQRSDLACY
jgi:hypothetical protein